MNRDYGMQEIMLILMYVKYLNGGEDKCLMRFLSLPRFLLHWL